MDEVVCSEWTNKPTKCGAYWMRQNAPGVYRICQIVATEGKLYITLAGTQGGLCTDDLDGTTFSFFGPLCLPSGNAYIFADGFYKEMDAPVEPQS